MTDALHYDFGMGVEAFSTRIATPLDFDVVMPLHQAHSLRVARVPATDAQLTGVDALITDVPGLRIGVKTADCVPILLYDTVHRAIGAVHSGWRGTVGNIISHAISAMTDQYGTVGSDLHAVIGPCIHQAAFEVGDELYDAFCAAGYGSYCCRMADADTGQRIKWHIDLPGICYSQLRNMGVENVCVSDICTYEHHGEFYSARRLGPNFGTQRILNCIMLQSDSACR